MKNMTLDDPYTSPATTEETHTVLMRWRVAARVIGVAILLMSLLPLSATMFLLNQELQIVPLDFELVGFGGPGFNDEWQLSMRQLLGVLAGITGVAWAIGAYLAFVIGRAKRFEHQTLGG
jgi:hypothetical protein